MPTPLTIVLKFLWFIFSRLLIWAAAIGLVVLAFFAGMDYMNAHILIKDGMQERANVIILGDDPSTLTQVFSKNFLAEDELLSSDPYQSYDVSDFDYDIDVSFALVFPWQDTVKLQVTEEVSNIDATLASSADSDISETPPQWDNAVYEITLVRYEDNWRIVSMEMLEDLPEPSPSPSASPSISLTESGETIEE